MSFVYLRVANNPIFAGLTHRILSIRGQRVMLDFHLAALYGVETRILNQAVRRNKERFPPDFMFQLTREEIKRLSQFVITSRGGKNQRFAPRITAFSEHGVAMLSSVLRSAQAVQVNIQIMRTFGRLRRMISDNVTLAKRLDELERRCDIRFKDVFDALRDLMASPKKPSRQIGFRP